MLDSNLRGTQYVPGRMQRYGYVANFPYLAVLNSLQRHLPAESRAQHVVGIAGREVMRMPGAGMIGVGMGNDRAFDRSPRINIEITRFAEESARGVFEQCHSRNFTRALERCERFTWTIAPSLCQGQRVLRRYNRHSLDLANYTTAPVPHFRVANARYVVAGGRH